MRTELKKDSAFDQLIIKYLKRERIALNQGDFLVHLRSSPDYPSYKSITDTLDYFQIKNIAVNVPKEQLDHLPKRFLIILSEDFGTLGLVSRKRIKVAIHMENGRVRHLSRAAFKEIWDGMILAVESPKNQVLFSKQPSLMLGFLTLTIFSFLLIFLGFSWPLLTHVALALTGSLLSILIISEDLGVWSALSEKICNINTKASGCQQVIHSSASKVLGLSLSDLSAVFFMGTLGSLLLLGYDLAFFFWLSLLTIPVVVYSFYAQLFVIRQWCPLCIGIALTLAGLFVNNGYVVQGPPNFYSMVPYLLVFTLTFMAWNPIRTSLEQSLALKQLKSDFLKFKKSEGLFTTLLQKHALPTKTQFPDFASIQFGNPEASLTFTAITNPLCGYCRSTFEQYKQLLESHGDSIKIRFVFLFRPDVTSGDLGFRIANAIVRLYQKSPSEAYASLIHWFDYRKEKEWWRRYGMPANDSSRNVLVHHEQWARQQKISYTPATCINDFLFPTAYELEDFTFFADELHEMIISIKEKEQAIAQ